MLKLKDLDRSIAYQYAAENAAWKLIHGVRPIVSTQISLALKKSVPAMRVVKRKKEKSSK